MKIVSIILALTGLSFILSAIAYNNFVMSVVGACLMGIGLFWGYLLEDK